MATEQELSSAANNQCQPGSVPNAEFDLNLRPGIHMSPPSSSGSATKPPPPGLPAPTSQNQPMLSTGENMDDLALSFAGAFTVTNTPNDTNRPHPRFAQFKMKTSRIGQAERRRRILVRQKEKREEAISHARALAYGEYLEGEGEGEAEAEAEAEDEEDMDVETPVRVFRKSYKNQLMLSEWMVEVPEDLISNWIFVLCPEGRRNFVIASNGCTKAYSKHGFMVKNFPSNLPGGNRHQRRRRDTYTILDCVFSEPSKVFYVLDMMCWNGHTFYDCDFEFRITWLQQKFLEDTTLVGKSKINPYTFMPLPVYECTAESISTTLNSEMPFKDKLDGILFYHKHVHYNPGTTPLVGWLQAYMVPELMKIEVKKDLMAQQPANYEGMKEYLKKTFDKTERLKKENEEKQDHAMDEGNEC